MYCCIADSLVAKIGGYGKRRMLPKRRCVSESEIPLAEGWVERSTAMRRGGAQGGEDQFFTF